MLDGAECMPHNVIHQQHNGNKIMELITDKAAAAYLEAMAQGYIDGKSFVASHDDAVAAVEKETAMHINPRFNIVQEPKVNGRLFVVVEGQRLASGSMAYGAKILTAPMSRDDAIALADKMEKDMPA
jgi:hypothetical protein